MWKILSLALAAFAIAGPAQAQPPVWFVRDADSEMVLFGSIHVLPPDRLYLTPKELIGEMRTKYNTIIAGGQGRLKDSIVRIGHLGFFTESDLTATLEQLGAALKNLTRR